MSLHEATALAHKNPEQTMPSCGRLFIQTWRHNKRSGAGDAAPAKHPVPPAKHALYLVSLLLVEDPPSSQGDDPGGAGRLRRRAYLPAGEAEAGAGNHGQSGGEAAADQGGRRINPCGAGQSSLPMLHVLPVLSLLPVLHVLSVLPVLHVLPSLARGGRGPYLLFTLQFVYPWWEHPAACLPIPLH